MMDETQLAVMENRRFDSHGKSKTYAVAGHFGS